MNNEPTVLPNDEFAQSMIINAIRQLAYIPLDQLKRMYTEGDRSVYDHVAFASILDPGSYLTNLRSGAIDDARYQARIVGKVYELMVIVHEREDFVNSRQLAPDESEDARNDE